jgi:hypothetical protein
MTKQELEKELNIIDLKYDIEKKKAIIKYCDANNPYKVGDTFTDHIGSIKIEKIMYDYSMRLCCVYNGSELKKDGTPRKDGAKRNAWQSNSISK